MTLAATADAPRDAVRFEGVTRRYGPDRVVFQKLDAAIPEAGVTFVVGRSGAGKSVLCRLAVGLERPDEGRVLLFDAEVQAMPERALLSVRRQAPYLVQAPALLDWLTVAQNVALAAPGASADAVAEALRRVGLEDAAHRLPTELGPGLRKRAAIARALALEPRFLLFDEPTTGLHRPAARQVADALERLRDEGLGAVVVSHDYPLLERIADRVLLVGGGGALAFDTREAFLGSDDPEVRALLDPVREELRRDG